MCGRYALFADPAEIAAYFDLEVSSQVEARPSYNVAPGQAVAAVRADEKGRRHVAALRWGLVPFWAKETSIGYRLINARGETLAERPAFREAFRRRRCLLPASGFYEWRKTSGRQSQPYFIAPSEEPLIAFAGLWERWRDPAGDPLESCTIVTVPANAVVAPIHDRMPLTIGRSAFGAWLDTSADPALDALVAGGPRLEARAVSRAVNDPRHDSPALIEGLPDTE